jgi:hypothetical protein
VARSAKVGDVIIALKAKTDDFQKNIGDASKRFATALGSMSSPVAALTNVLKMVNPATAAMAAGVGAAAAAAAAMANATAKAVREQQAFATSTGLAVDEVQRFEVAFNRLGSSGEAARKGFSAFEDLFSSAALGSEEATDRLKALGVQVEGVGSADSFEGALMSISKMGSDTEKLAALYGLVGDGAADMLAVVNQGEEALASTLSNASGFGETANNEFLALGKANSSIGDSISRWGDALAVIVVPAVRIASQVVATIAEKLATALEYVASWASWLNKAVGDYYPLMKAQEASAKAEEKSTGEIRKRFEANLKVQAELRAGEREILAYRNDYLKLTQDINTKHADASKEMKAQLLAQNLMIERQKVEGELMDMQVSIRSLVDHELSLRHKIAKEMQLATKEQKDQYFFLQRSLDTSSKLQSQRFGTAGGRRFQAYRDINDLEKYTDASKAELDSLRVAAENALKQGLGDQLTPSEVYRERVAAINADRFLSDDEKTQAVTNADRQQVLDKRSFLEGMGKIVTPVERFQQSVEAMRIDLEKGRITQDEYARLLSDNYKSQIGDQPKMAESLEAGTTQLYDRLAKFYSGMEDRPLEKQIAENGKKANVLLDKIERKIGTQQPVMQSIR